MTGEPIVLPAGVNFYQNNPGPAGYLVAGDMTPAEAAELKQRWLDSYWPSPLAEARAELDDIDRATGLAACPGWRPLGRVVVSA